jgi:heat shock protein 90kDa beta
MIGNAVVFASLMVALQIAVSRVSLLTDAAKDVHVHDHEHEHDHAHDHAHEHAEAAKASGVAAGLSAEEEAKLKNSGEKHTFGAEVNKLMQIIINSLYTNNEVFLRELISNASDALDKIRFLALTDASALGSGDAAKLEIKLQGDEKANTLTLTDTGVGMTKQDLINNLGTIAHSGTKDFLKKYSEYTESNLIGQFGVGFYSVFLVADSVTVVTKHNDDVQYVWQSTADGSFTVAPDPRGNTLGRGTQLIIHLKEDATEYAKVDTLKRLVAKYSEFINFPIKVWASREETKQVPMTDDELAEQLKLEADEAKDADADADADEEEQVDLDGDKKDADADAKKTPKKTTKDVSETVYDWELLNEVKPLWTRAPEDVSDDDYKEFYRTALKEYTDPLKWAHFNAEGEIEFKSLLYIPSTPPNNMFDGQPKKDNMKLFVRRVFITDDFSDILPKFLSFIKGLVDSDDLPLNVSREQLQQHKTLKIIKKKLIRKVIAMFQELFKAGGDDWKKFYENYGTALKLGVIEDAANRVRLSKLLQFHSTSTNELATFDEYVGRLKKGQDEIYYLAGLSKDELLKSPLLERLTKRGIEVLLMTEPIDEYVTQNMPKFDGKYTLTNVGKEGLKLPGDEQFEESLKDLKDTFKPLIDWLKTELPGVSKVVLSKRLVSTPAALVSATYGQSANMERIQRAQALGDKNAGFGMGSPPTLEINPRHAIIKKLLEHVEKDAVTDDDKAIATLIFETARLRSGFEVNDPVKFADAVNAFIGRNLDVSANGVDAFDEPVLEAAAADEPEADDADEEPAAHDEL